MSPIYRGTRRRPRWAPAPGHVALVAVAVAYATTVLACTSLSAPLAWDEAVYASQVAHQVPAAHFSAHRSRGMSLLLAPAAAVSAAPPLLRVSLAGLSGLLLYAAFRPWLRVFGRVRRYAPALAAGLFGSLWVTVLYGSMAYPNLFLAFALTAGVGLAVRPLLDRNATADWGAAVWALIAFGAASLLRPTDTAMVAAALLAGLGSALLVRRRCRLGTAASGLVTGGLVTGGLVIGWAAWAVEGFARFGGPVRRWRSGAGAVDNDGLTWNLPQHLAALDGPYLLCTEPRLCQELALPAAAWLLLLPMPLVLGLVAAARAAGESAGLFAALAVATAGGLAVSAPYFILVDHVAPRFLLPGYALMAPATAYGLLWLLDRRRAWARTLAVAALLTALLGHVLVQHDRLSGVRHHQDQRGESAVSQANYLGDVLGVTAPCLIVGEGAIEQGYLLRCRAWPATADTVDEHEARIAEAVARGETVVVRLSQDAPLPAFMAGWRLMPLPGDGTDLAYLPP